MERDIRVLRRCPGSYAALGFRQIVEHYEKPRARAGNRRFSSDMVSADSWSRRCWTVALESAAWPSHPLPSRESGRFPIPRCGWSRRSLLNLAHQRGRCVPLTPSQFHYAFMNSAPREEALRTYQRYAVPGPGHVLFQAGAREPQSVRGDLDQRAAQIRAPLLMMAGFAGPDGAAVAGAGQRAAPTAIRSRPREYKEFPGRTHFMIAQNGWQEVANYALDWVRDQELLKLREARRIVRELHARQVA